MRWGALFKPNPTYGLYLSHVQKAFHVLGRPVDWLTPRVRAAATGLKNLQNNSFRFPNYIFSDDLLRILEKMKLNSELGAICYLSFLFSLRIPSETFEIRRSFLDDRISEFPPQSEKVLIGPCTYLDTDLIVLKFSTRKNIKYGCILKRPCICKADRKRGPFLCPAHVLWPVLMTFAEPAELLFPEWNAGKFARSLRKLMIDLRYGAGDKFASKAFRRGASDEIRRSGSTFATILTSAAWNGAGFKAYLDLMKEEGANITALLLTKDDSDTSDEEFIKNKNLQKIQKRLKAIPSSFTKKQAKRGR